MNDNINLTATAATSATAVAVTPLPVGAIIAYGGASAPNGWLICDGSQLNGATYPNLVAVIGNKLPDLRSRFIVGAGNGAALTGYPLNSTGGLEAVTLTVNQIPAHQHFGFGEAYPEWPLGITGKNEMGSHGGKDNDNYYYGTTNTGGSQSHENRPPYYALTYIIKY